MNSFDDRPLHLYVMITAFHWRIRVTSLVVKAERERSTT